MYAAFKTVIERGEDTKSKQREDACREAGLLDNYAAANVMSILAKELGL